MFRDLFSFRPDVSDLAEISTVIIDENGQAIDSGDCRVLINHVNFLSVVVVVVSHTYHYNYSIGICQ